MVVIYRMNLASYWIAKGLVRVDHVALPNLIAGSAIVPELIQGDCTPQNIRAEIDRYLVDAAHAESVRQALRAVRRRLGEPGVFRRVAERVLANLTPAEITAQPRC